MFSSPHIGTVAFNQKWVPLIFCSLFCLQICDPRSSSQIELLSCLVYEKSLGHDWMLAALNSWMNNIKSWSIFQDCHWSSWPSWSLSFKINLGRSHQVIEQGTVITWDWERNKFAACPYLEIVYFGAMLRVACFHPFYKYSNAMTVLLVPYSRIFLDHCLFLGVSLAVLCWKTTRRLWER